jgi:hemoglobin-like flavoprotein
MFYERLFATDPTLRSLFKGDMVVQGRLPMTMIETAVENVHQLDQILPAVRDLGRRDARYGVKAADYDTVAGALLRTLQQALGSEFTPAVRDAWVASYQTLAGEMKAAAPVGGEDVRAGDLLGAASRLGVVDDRLKRDSGSSNAPGTRQLAGGPLRVRAVRPVGHPGGCRGAPEGVTAI